MTFLPQGLFPTPRPYFCPRALLLPLGLTLAPGPYQGLPPDSGPYSCLVAWAPRGNTLQSCEVSCRASFESCCQAWITSPTQDLCFTSSFASLPCFVSWFRHCKSFRKDNDTNQISCIRFVALYHSWFLTPSFCRPPMLGLVCAERRGGEENLLTWLSPVHLDLNL